MAYILVSPFRFPLRTALHRRAADIQPSAKSTEKGRREAPRGANGALPHHVTPEPLRQREANYHHDLGEGHLAPFGHQVPS